MAPKPMNKNPALNEWQPTDIGTLVYLQRTHQAQQQVLLINKLRGHGAGLINAPGGKVEAGESVYAGAARELVEEVGLACTALQLRACIRFVQQTPLPAQRDSKPDQWLGFAFTSQQFQGAAITSSEAEPHWYATTEFPWSQMWPTDQLWLPQVLAPPDANKPVLAVTLQFSGNRLVHQQSHNVAIETVRTLLASYNKAHLLP